MAYTVKKLAKLSGVSVRTLRFYDEIGLLKPNRVGANGYRYYEEAELLLLQQILFYRELGFPLTRIQEIVTAEDFDKLAALKSHREALLADASRLNNLIKTIDKTIGHLEGGFPMAKEDLYAGFDQAKQEEYEKYLVDRYGESAKDNIAASKKAVKNWTKDDFDKVKSDYDRLHKEFVRMIEKKLPATAPEVLELVRQHHEVVRRFYEPSREVYAGLGKLYMEHPDFQKLYMSYHPNLACYLAEAMAAFAAKNLK